MIYKILLSYAVGKGFLNAFKKRKPMTMAEWGRTLQRYYVQPILKLMNDSNILELRDLVGQEYEVRVVPGSLMPPSYTR